ncbi:Lipid A biosynthesis lauroyl acyltransferase (EC [Olavius algarvensis associated proteobacterium Delta 3]|nr:Lipid A biosynthesis lauroyl acyltransferase (EC [Olavius algarvensis associated proteobacterium Delta 3]CAB5084898.1 Lipid A biosynthesis lauroyl acyltransferase (EC [Olavius algarvensis associated proteobacterium Delta 3]
MTSHIRESLGYGVLKWLFRCLGCVSPQTAGKIADRLGWVLFHLDKRHRTIALNNLERAFGEGHTPAQNRRIALTVFRNLVRMLFEISWSMRLPLEELKRHFRVKGHLNFTHALRKGKGILMLTGHAGNWELLPIVGAMVNLPVNVLYRPLDSPVLERFITELRSRFGARMIPTAKSARRVLKALLRGEIFAILMDQNVDWYEGVFADFFGHRACTNKGMALLALKTGAPVVPIFLVRETGGFMVEISAEVPLIRTGDKIKDLEENTQRYNAVIEDFVRRYPDQWFWVHQRWKTPPYHPWPRKTE